MSSEKEKTSECSSAMAIFVIDSSGNVTFAEGRVDALGLNQRVESCVPAVEVFRASPSILEKIRNAMAGRAGCLDIPSGDRTFELQFQPRPAGGALAIAVDATRQRSVERDLRTVLQRLEEAQCVAHVGSFEWNISANVVTWSDELHRIYGLDPYQVPNSGVRRFPPPSHLPPRGNSRGFFCPLGAPICRTLGRLLHLRTRNGTWMDSINCRKI